MLADRIIAPFTGNGTYFWQLLYFPYLKLTGSSISKFAFNPELSIL
jgi:hypothetical protein